MKTAPGRAGRPTTILVTLVGISTAAALAGCTATGDTETSAPSATTSTAVPGSAPANEPTYVDGEYAAVGQYGNLPSRIGVTVTLDDDVITAVEVTPYATNPTSLDLQERFAAAVPGVVVGRDIDEVRVSRLAGSSATPDGFNAALDQIKADAAR